MVIKINGRTQISFEKFEQTFSEVFGREMTPEERQWLSTAQFARDPSPPDLDDEDVA